MKRCLKPRKRYGVGPEIYSQELCVVINPGVTFVLQYVTEAWLLLTGLETGFTPLGCKVCATTRQNRRHLYKATLSGKVDPVLFFSLLRYVFSTGVKVPSQ